MGKFLLGVGHRLAKFIYDNFGSVLSLGKGIVLFGGKVVWYGAKGLIYVAGTLVSVAGGALSLVTGIGGGSSSSSSGSFLAPRVRKRNNGLIELLAEAASFGATVATAPLGLRRGERFKRGYMGGRLTRRKMIRRQRRKTARKY